MGILLIQSLADRLGNLGCNYGFEQDALDPDRTRLPVVDMVAEAGAQDDGQIGSDLDDLARQHVPQRGRSYEGARFVEIPNLARIHWQFLREIFPVISGLALV